MVELHQKDRYSRVVGMAYVRSFPFYRRQNVSEVLLKAGRTFQYPLSPFQSFRNRLTSSDTLFIPVATVYRQAGAVHAGQLSRFEELEAKARSVQSLDLFRVSSHRH